MSSIREKLAALIGGAGAGAAGPTSIKAIDLAGDLLNVQLIDVREPHEWTSGHVAGAVHIPLGRLRQSIASVSSSRKVAVICRSGIRSQRAAKMLRAHAFDAVSVSGGMLAWTRAGLPIVRGATASGKDHR